MWRHSNRVCATLGLMHFHLPALLILQRNAHLYPTRPFVPESNLMGFYEAEGAVY
jgi:hypothetical protein